VDVILCFPWHIIVDYQLYCRNIQTTERESTPLLRLSYRFATSVVTRTLTVPDLKESSDFSRWLRFKRISTWGTWDWGNWLWRGRDGMSSSFSISWINWALLVRLVTKAWRPLTSKLQWTQ
jgi:hypothetical protein